MFTIEPQNDLGVKPEEKDKIVERLVSQGIADIEFIQGNVGVKYTPGAPVDDPPASAPKPADSPVRPATAPAAATGDPAATPYNARRHNGAGRSTLQLF